MNDCALLTTAEAAACDRWSADRGTPVATLMEAAGRAVALATIRLWPRGPVLVLCGPGNNGGDGLVAARFLLDAGWPVTVALLADGSAMKGCAADNLARWTGPTVPLGPGVFDGHALDGQPRPPVVIDALFGAGLARPLDGVARAAVDEINRLGLACLAVDVPSGVSGDTGQVLGTAPRCRATVTFFRRKPGHLLQPGRDLCGQVTVADIGISAAALDALNPQTFANCPALWRSQLPGLATDAHKYSRGHLVVVGGGEMTGAARLAARGARRAGAGMVTLAAPTQAVPVYRTGDPGLIVVPVDDTAQLLAYGRDPRRRAFVLGPGLGLEAAERVRGLVLAALGLGRAAVLDADALTAFAGAPQRLFNAVTGPTVLTPHEGEFNRLFPDALGDKLTRARSAARRSGSVVVLKGADTVIADPGGRAAINENAPPTLATAGAGDVLAGVIAGLMAQGMAAFEAAAAAVWLHGEAARLGPPGLIAEDLPEGIAAAIAALTDTA
jgi:hydroxyethylthiazole kinase-like uncharacterized protein yjeF